MGFGNDVAVATEINTSTTVPVLVNGMFVDGAASPHVVHRAEQRQT
jgi:phosphosulfolactate phosphohydrolase-like enzyme